jgi:hypothetical protein
MSTTLLQHFRVWTESHGIIEDSAYATLNEYRKSLAHDGGIYDAKNKGWIPYHRINYIQHVQHVEKP